MPETLKIRTEGVGVHHVAEVPSFKDEIDVMILCGGSATDLPVQTPEYAEMFNVINSFDTHARIPEHFAAVDAAARKGGKIGIISVGWDPGMFSLNPADGIPVCSPSIVSMRLQYFPADTTTPSGAEA